MTMAITDFLSITPADCHEQKVHGKLICKDGDNPRIRVTVSFDRSPYNVQTCGEIAVQKADGSFSTLLHLMEHDIEFLTVWRKLTPTKQYAMDCDGSFSEAFKKMLYDLAKLGNAITK